MRIISGTAKGRNILSPVGMDTRPILDRVKESMFNIIQDKIYGSIVMDLFSGTGSLGLEAASRGAKKCYLIEKEKDVFSLLQKNIINSNLDHICEAYNMDSYRFLKKLASKSIKFDLIFIDPPYFKNMVLPAIELITENDLLNEDGLIIIKISSKEKIHINDEKIELVDYRKYGNTVLEFYKWRVMDEKSDISREF